MKTPIITVKKLQTFRGHDGVGVNADIYVDGVLIGYFHDGAYGGEPEFDSIRDDIRAIAKIKDIETYVKTLPMKDIDPEKIFGKPMLIKQDIYTLMDDAVNDAIGKKADQKNDKVKMKAIMYGIPSASNYHYISWKGRTLADIVALPNGINLLQTQVDRIKKVILENGKGEIFLNADYLKSLGCKL
jgi:hypothetical protein